MNQHEVAFPFKRYQMQPVWRADRPQKGRYREFWQCDADVLGTDSLLCEADFIQIYHSVFRAIGLEDYEIRINHRKILEAVTEKANASEHFKVITVIIDKADKIGLEGVSKELEALGLNKEQIHIILSLLDKTAFNEDCLSGLAERLAGIPSAEKALNDLGQVLRLSGIAAQKVCFDGSLARGLDYYTGCIFEVVPTSVKMGSISGGGRYDDLTGVFGLKGISGIGISFGIDRIYDVLEELQTFPKDNAVFTDVLFCAMDEAAIAYSMPLAASLREQDIRAEIYPQAAKLKKQLDYANAKHISWAVIIGENEMKNDSVTLKNLVTGNQELIDKEKIGLFIS
jgi:histidyl-tRNA synthetase